LVKSQTHEASRHEASLKRIVNSLGSFALHEMGVIRRDDGHAFSSVCANRSVGKSTHFKVVHRMSSHENFPGDFRCAIGSRPFELGYDRCSHEFRLLWPKGHACGESRHAGIKYRSDGTRPEFFVARAYVRLA